MSSIKVLCTTLTSIMLINIAQAKSVDIHEELSRLLSEHALIAQVDQEIVSAQQQVKSARSDWYPTLSLSAESGNEEIYRETTDNSTDFETSKLDVSLTQTLWDFGKTSSVVSIANRQLEIKLAERSLQAQNLILAGIEAYVNLKKAYRVSLFSKQSEENIKRQTRLEDARTKKGKGYTIDVLQAKAQLAGARAKRVRDEQVLSMAKTRYAAVFNRVAPVYKDMPTLPLPKALLPRSLDELMYLLALNNPDVIRDRANVAEAAAQRQRVKSTQWMPSLTLVASMESYTNVDGAEGLRETNEIALQFNWNLNLAGQAYHEVKAASATEAAQQKNADYTMLTVTETAQNAWVDLQLANERTGYLQDQADIAEQFLRMARKERELGRRSLIDVLSGETSLINSQSEYRAAQADVIIASFNILRTMGKLTLADLDDAYLNAKSIE